MTIYPYPIFKTKRLLKDAIILAGEDVPFVVGFKFFGTPVIKKLSELLEPGEVIGFCGPRPEEPKYYGRIARSPIRGIEDYSIE